METHLKIKRSYNQKAAAFRSVAPISIVTSSSTVSTSSTPGFSYNLTIPDNAYDPSQPNDYNVWAPIFEAKRIARGSDDESENPSAADLGVSVPPPSSMSTTTKAAESKKKPKLSLLSATPASSHGDSFGMAMLAKYGWKEGQGLGKNQQGISVALKVEKVGRTGGRIIDRHAAIKNYLAKLQSASVESGSSDTDQPKSSVILLTNMVEHGEDRSVLREEIEQECTDRFGPTKQVVVHESKMGEDRKVGVFVEFANVGDASKAHSNMNGRFFGGKKIHARYYDTDRFNKRDLDF